MSDLVAARQWAARARELLKARKTAGFGDDARQLQGDLQALLQQAKSSGQLAPELAKALGELALALPDELDVDGALSPSQLEERQMYDDFRGEVVRQQKALAKVATQAEVGTLELALELADDQARMRQFDSAITLLQQASHRARAIQDEGRQSREGGPPEDTTDSDQAQQRQKDRAAFNTAGAVVAGLMEQMAPLSPKEKVLCTVFAALVQQKALKERYGDALVVVDEWTKWLRDTLANDQDGNARRERERQRLESQQRARDQLDKLGLAQAVQAIETSSNTQHAELVAISQEIGRYTLGQPHKLQSDVGALAFEVERRLQGLRGAEEPVGDKQREDSVRKLAKAQDALLALQAKRLQADDLLAQAKTDFADQLKSKQDALDDFLKEQDAAVQIEADDVQTRQAALTEHAKQARANDNNPFAASVLDWYAKKEAEIAERAKKLKGKATLSQADLDMRAKAVAVRLANDKNAVLKKSLDDAQQRLSTAQEQRDAGRAPLDAALEHAKLQQAINWEAPADITYGTPLTDAQLNATLSVDNGHIEYRVKGGDLIVPGDTMLPAGDGQVLVATVEDGDSATFQVATPKEVTINVRKAAITLTARSALAYDYGTPFKQDMLEAAVSTAPALERIHAGLLAGLVTTASGKALAAGQVLDAKDHALTTRHPGNSNYAPSNEVTTTLTVRPAQQEIVWEGAAPITFTYGRLLTASQLNATVKVTTAAKLDSRWAELTQALVYTTETNSVVKLDALLKAGDARRITVNTPPRPNFLPAAPKSVDFKVDKLLCKLEGGPPPPLGAVLQPADLKQLQATFKVSAGKGTLAFFIGTTPLAAGLALEGGKTHTLRVEVVPDDSNHAAPPAQEFEVQALSFADKSQAAKDAGAALLQKKVHTEHTKAVQALQKKIDDLTDEPDEDKFVKINALLEEIAEIEASLATWQGPVKVPLLSGDGKLLDVTIDVVDGDTAATQRTKKVNKTIEATKALVKHGGLKLADIAKLVPSGTSNTFGSSKKYPNGFKYSFTTPAGVDIEIYGHGPTVADNVDDASDSKKGNLVRVMIGTQYMKPDGTLTPVPTDVTSHMPLY